MNELLSWYGYDKVSRSEAQNFNLEKFRQEAAAVAAAAAAAAAAASATISPAAAAAAALAAVSSSTSPAAAAFSQLNQFSHLQSVENRSGIGGSGGGSGGGGGGDDEGALNLSSGGKYYECHATLPERESINLPLD